MFASGSLTPAVSAQTAISPGAASQLVVQTQPSSSATAGQPFPVQPVIDEEDPYGNLITSDSTSVVTVSKTSGRTPLEGDTTAIIANGVANFTNLADDTAEAVTLTFSSGSLKAVESPDIDVSPAAPARLVIQTEPSATATAGQIFATQPVIEEEDQYGNLETGDNSTVVTVSPFRWFRPTPGSERGDGQRRGDFTGLAEDRAGTLGLKFTSGSLTAASSGTVTIVPAAADALVVTEEPPSSVTAGVGFGLVVTSVDPFGNVVPSFDGTVSLALANNPRASTLNGTLTVAAENGVASFAGLTIDTAAGGYTIEATGGRLSAAVGTPINVTPAAAVQLVVTSGPPGVSAPDSGLALVVAAEDPFGNVVTSQAGTVTVGIASGPGGTLSGTSTAPLVNGTATLTGLTLNEAGGYALEVTGAGLSPAALSPINVTHPPTITGEQVLTSGSGKHKKSIGFELFFSAALDPSRAQNAANYTITQTVKHGRKTSAKAVAFHALYNASTQSVSLIVAGEVPFTLGGQIVVNAAPPAGITDTSGTALDGDNAGIPGDNAVLAVLKKDRGITA